LAFNLDKSAMATNTPKLNILAKRFQNQIQDPVTEDVNGNIVPGELVPTVAELETYLGNACQKYVEQVYTQSAGYQDFITKLPELFKSFPVTFSQGSNVIDLSNETYLKDVWEVLDSQSGSTLIEVWNKVHQADALTGNDPFYTADAEHPALIYNKPFLFIFPATITDDGNYGITLNYIKLPLNPETGEYLTINGGYDLPFTLKQIQDIADIAEQLYRKDSLEVDSG
jgi:hypothetical protein